MEDKQRNIWVVRYMQWIRQCPKWETAQVFDTREEAREYLKYLKKAKWQNYRIRKYVQSK